MAYLGRFTDRFPKIPAAGTSTKLEGSACEAFKYYNIEEGAEDIIKAVCHENYRTSFIPAAVLHLPECNVKDVLDTELKKSRFVAFREKFSEDLYFKKPELGKVYPLNSKPENITNENTTFGQKTLRSESLYSLVLPKKTPDEVNREYSSWHDKHIISHKHYFPSERINRSYDSKSFDPETTFGYRNNADKSGRNVKQCLMNCDRLIVISKPQKRFLEKSLGRLGKRINKYNYEVPDIVFGRPTPFADCDAKSLVEKLSPCVKKTQLFDAISSLIKLRRHLFENPDFYIYDLKVALEKYDIKQRGFLSTPKIFEITNRLFIRINEEKMRVALRHYGMIKDEGKPTERINYEQFWKLLDMQIPLPKTGSLSPMPPELHNKDTIYRDLCKDREKKPNEFPPLTPRMLLKLEEKDETTAKDVIEPDIPMHFGLTPKDFKKPRPKEQLRRIFQRLLTVNFDTVWDRAVAKLKPENDLISVDQLRNEMSKEDSDKK